MTCPNLRFGAQVKRQNCATSGRSAILLRISSFRSEAPRSKLLCLLHETFREIRDFGIGLQSALANYHPVIYKKERGTHNDYRIKRQPGSETT